MMERSQASQLIRLTKKIEQSLCNRAVGAGDASEATLQDILAELRDDQAITENLVQDTAGVIHIRRTIVNQDTGAITTEYLDPQTNLVSTPTFPLASPDAGIEIEFLSAQTVDTTKTPILVRSSTTGAVTTYTRVDTGAALAVTDFEALDEYDYELDPRWEDTSVANDFTTLVPMYIQFKINRRTGERTINGYFEKDEITPYTLNTPDGCRLYKSDEIGDDARTNVVIFDLAPNSNWVVPAGIYSWSVLIDAVGDTANPPTITTFVDPNDAATAITARLRSNMAASVNKEDGTVMLVPGVIIQSNNAGDDIQITYTNLYS